MTDCFRPEASDVDQVAALSHLTAAFRVGLVLGVAPVLDGLGAAVGVAVVVEEAAEGELVEGVFGVLAVAEPAAEHVVEVVLAVAVAAPQFVGVHGVEVGGVGGVGHGGDVRRRLLPQVAGEVDGPEEGVSFDLVGAILAQAVLRASAQLHDEVRRLGAELGRRGDVQRALPVDHLTAERRSGCEQTRREDGGVSPTFSCVSRGVLAKNGGCPTTISYKMTPTLHQSHSWVYPGDSQSVTVGYRRLQSRLLKQSPALGGDLLVCLFGTKSSS